MASPSSLWGSPESVLMDGYFFLGESVTSIRSRSTRPKNKQGQRELVRAPLAATTVLVDGSSLACSLGEAVRQDLERFPV